jgi:type II secretory pathway component PulF
MKLSQAMARHPAYFSFFYVNVIRSGENSGRLKDSLEQILVYLRRIYDLRLKVRQALAYPIFMTLVGIALIFVMLSFVLPRLAGMFADYEMALPAPTRVLLIVGNFFHRSWFMILGFLAVPIIFFWFRIRKQKAGFWGQLKYKLPLIKNLSEKQAMANFSTSLALLLKSGINLLQALEIATPIIENKNYIQSLFRVQLDIKDGKSFASSVERFKIFSTFFVQMIKIGEESGRLESVLADIAQSYQEEIEADIKIITTLLEPAIILVLGLIIGGMVIAVLLPIFNINALIG